MEFEMESARSIVFRQNNQLPTSTVKEHNHKSKLKFVIVGDPHVGKTSLIKAYVSNQFQNHHTLHDCVVKNHMGMYLDKMFYDLAILDIIKTAENFADIQFDKVDCFILCYSVNDTDSFENVEKKWVPELSSKYPAIPIVVVATKSDLKRFGDTVLLQHQIECLHNKVARFLTASAKTREGIESVFLAAIQSAVHHRQDGSRPTSQCCCC